MVGAAKAKERRPLAERMSGTVSRCLFVDLKFLVGVQGTSNSQKSWGDMMMTRN